MKKNLVRTMLAAIVVLSMTACGTKAVCDICGEEKTCKKKEALGEELMICNDCMDELENLADMMGM